MFAFGGSSSKEVRVNFDDSLVNAMRGFPPVLYPAEAWEKFLKKRFWNSPGFKMNAHYTFQHLPYLLKLYE